MKNVIIKYINYIKNIFLLLITNTSFSKFSIKIENEKYKFEWKMPQILVF